jgi:hypothetical protein
MGAPGLATFETWADDDADRMLGMRSRTILHCNRKGLRS